MGGGPAFSFRKNIYLFCLTGLPFKSAASEAMGGCASGCFSFLGEDSPHEQLQKRTNLKPQTNYVLVHYSNIDLGFIPLQYNILMYFVVLSSMFNQRCFHFSAKGSDGSWGERRP